MFPAAEGLAFAMGRAIVTPKKQVRGAVMPGSHDKVLLLLCRDGGAVASFLPAAPALHSLGCVSDWSSNSQLAVSACAVCSAVVAVLLLRGVPSGTVLLLLCGTGVPGGSAAVARHCRRRWHSAAAVCVPPLTSGTVQWVAGVAQLTNDTHSVRYPVLSAAFVPLPCLSALPLLLLHRQFRLVSCKSLILI